MQHMSIKIGPCEEEEMVILTLCILVVFVICRFVITIYGRGEERIKSTNGYVTIVRIRCCFKII